MPTNVAPQFKIQVEGQELSQDITQFINSVEYESSDVAIDKIKLVMANPDFVLTERKLFLPGNEIALWFGYDELKFIGRGIVIKPRPRFPNNDMATLEVTAYTKDYSMTQKKPTGPARKSKPGRKTEEERRLIRLRKIKKSWGKAKISDVIKDIISRPNYDFKIVDNEGNSTIDTSPQSDINIYQMKDVTDFDMCIGLANMLGWYFWVDGTEDGKWLAHFKNQGTVEKAQTKKYKFVYNDGNLSSLLSFTPEMLFSDHYTTITARITLKNGKVVEKTFVTGESDWSPLAENERQRVDGKLGTPESIKLFVKDYSFDILNVDSVKTVSDLEWLVNAWIALHKNTFIVGKGTAIGVEDIFARQRHTLENLGTVYNGDYYFSRVRHKMDADNGYELDFHARKIDE